MAAKRKKKSSRAALQKKIRSLRAELLTLQSGHPTYTSDKKRLESEIQLAKAEMRSQKRRSAVRREVTAKSVPDPNQKSAAKKKKRVPLPGGASFPSFKLPDPKSPTFYDDSAKTFSSLRQFCKQAAGYIGKADSLFDSLHGVGSHLHQAGVLPKITKGNFKELSMGDWTAVLMALMNSPLSGLLLGGGQQKQEGEKKEEAATESTEDKKD